jgi:hypothetical protein
MRDDATCSDKEFLDAVRRKEAALLEQIQQSQLIIERIRELLKTIDEIARGRRLK